MAWIPVGTARDILHRYWRLVLPESAPAEDGFQDGPANLAYDTPSVFYQFLTDYYIPVYRDQILIGKKAAQGTMATIFELNGVEYFIASRRRFLEVYAQWLLDRGYPNFELPGDKDEAVVQRRLLEVGIPLRGEENNPATWRHSFYGKSRKAISCFALPVAELPESVCITFGKLFGT